MFLLFSKRLTAEQLGLTVDKLGFSRRAVALAGVVKNLDKGALLSCWTSGPLVQSIIKHQVKLCTVLRENSVKRWEWVVKATSGTEMLFNADTEVVFWLHKLSSDLEGSKKRNLHTLLGSMPLTCRNCSIVHCDLLTKAEDPWNCFTFVMDTFDGFLFVTVETKRIKDTRWTWCSIKCNIKDNYPCRRTLLIIEGSSCIT